MNQDHEASRTLVKSPPELWAECSDAGSLARHLGEFGEIRITRLEPETIVAWEGERASGTVRIEPSGWGTRVTLTAQMEAQEPARVQAPAAPEPQPVPAQAVATPPAPPAAAPPPHPAAAPSPRGGLLGRLRLRFRGPAAQVAVAPPPPVVDPPPPVPEPEPVPEPVAPEPAADAAPNPAAVLTAALDSLGQAHHRPFSRA